MANRIERVEARIAADQAARIRYAAGLLNTSVSSFIVSSAAARAEEVIASHTETTVPAEYFDRMLEELDEAPKVIPSLARAARRVLDKGAAKS